MNIIKENCWCTEIGIHFLSSVWHLHIIYIHKPIEFHWLYFTVTSSNESTQFWRILSIFFSTSDIQFELMSKVKFSWSEEKDLNSSIFSVLSSISWLITSKLILYNDSVILPPIKVTCRITNNPGNMKTMYSSINFHTRVFGKFS